MTLTALAAFVVQAGWLGSAILGILLLLGLAGLSIIAWLLPRFFQVRWLVFAPIAGLALITLVSLPLAFLGLPARSYAWPLLFILGALSGVSVWLAWRNAGPLRRYRVLLAYPRRNRGALALGFGVVVLLSTKMLTYGSSTGRADGAWGSTDFGAYWIVADYLQQHGADVASYEAQSTYRASDIDEHLHLHARLGGMTTIAVLAHAIMPGRVAAMINPLIVASLFLLVAVVECFARRERLWPSTGLLASAFHPFLYFLLFYTYLGQAFSVLLIASGVFVAEASDRQAGDGTWHRGAIGAGLFFAAAILQYASAFLVPGIFLASFFLFRRRRGAMMSALICGGTILVVAGYHLPRSIRELTAIRSLKVMPGWEWHRLVNVQELLGLRSLIHYEPQHSDLVASLVTFAITALVAFALCVHLRRGALPRSAAAMIISTCALAAYACLKYWQHVPNATHGLAKVVSQYAIFILLFAAAGVVAFFPTRHRRAQNCLQLALGVFVVIQFLQVVNWRRAPWFDYDLITLTTRHESAEKIIFDDDVDDRLFMPLTKNIGRLATGERTGPRLRFTLESRRDRFPDAALVDREGAYVALRENKIVGRASR